MEGVGLDKVVRVLRAGARVTSDEVEHLRGWIPLHRCSYGRCECKNANMRVRFLAPIGAVRNF